jgi:acyl-homoserine lactone acylase PvdQ
MNRHRGGVVAVSVVLAMALLACAPVDPLGKPSSRPAPVERSRYIMPPGNYGGLPTTVNSTDQIPLYDALTPLRGHVTDADIDRDYIPENFAPVGQGHVEATGRPGTTIVYDSYGVPHISGVTRADLAFGAGWVTARDRGLLLQLGRGPARVAVADVPGINAFGLVTSGQSFVPSAATEQLVTDQVKTIVDTYGSKGREMLADMQAEADGITAYNQSHGVDQPPATVNDVIAVTAFIGSIFGAGGGAEASNAEFLATLRNHLGGATGHKAWLDAMLFDDPEAPTTLTQRFDYGPLTGGSITGSVAIDENSIVSLDPRNPSTGLTPAVASLATPVPAAAAKAAGARPSTTSSSTTSTSTSTSTSTTTTSTTSTPAAPMSASAVGSTVLASPSSTAATYPAAGPVPYKQASNFLVVDPSRSAAGDTVAVMGPQLGYYYPEIVEQVHLTGPGIDAQGVGVPAAMMYILIGRTHDYAWSLTSANQDVRDVFAEQLCNPDGSTPTRASNHYLYKGVCRAFTTFDAGTLNGTPIRYPVSVHGPVIGTAPSHGRAVALTRQRSTFGRDGLNLGALKDLTEGRATSAKRFYDIADQFGFTFHWAYASRDTTAYFSSGRLPRRAPGLDRRLPTLGTGQYDWRGFLSEDEHPHGRTTPQGLLLNWNNQSAPGFMHGDDDPYGSVHRVELFNQFPQKVTLADDVSVMNRAATEDVRAPVWPVVSRVLRTGPAPNALDAKVLDVLDEWVRRDAPTVDADNNGQNDDAGATISDALWNPVADAVMRPQFGDLTADLDQIRGLGSLSGESYVDKDLRTLLGEPVRGKFHLRYCGRGDLVTCRASLWAAVDRVAAGLAAAQGPDPTAWRSAARRTGFTPGLIPDTFRATNRPTFQQVLELPRVHGHGHH